MERLQGRRAIVTGAASGIGRATALLFAQHGARVFAVDRAELSFDQPNIEASILDVADEDGWRALTDSTGTVDILVNNAGIGGSTLPLAEEALADWERVVAVNQTGPFLGMRAVLPGMRAQRRGSIINISSIWGISAIGGAAAYHASKAGLRHLSKHAAVAYAADGVRVNSVHPGIIQTPLMASQPAEANAAVIAATPMRRVGQPIEIAQGCLFLASDDASFVTGTELVIDGGYLAA